MEDSIWKWKYSCSLLFVLFFTAQCGKEQKVLPAMTREGRNTFGFINSEGDVFADELQTDQIDYNKNSGILRFESSYEQRVWSASYLNEFNMSLQLIDSLNCFELKDVSYVRDNREFKLDTTHCFFEQTYFNPNRNILSGNFEMNMIEVDTFLTGDTLLSVYLSNGRFDIRYQD